MCHRHRFHVTRFHSEIFWDEQPLEISLENKSTTSSITVIYGVIQEVGALHIFVFRWLIIWARGSLSTRTEIDSLPAEVTRCESNFPHLCPNPLLIVADSIFPRNNDSTLRILPVHCLYNQIIQLNLKLLHQTPSLDHSVYISVFWIDRFLFAEKTSCFRHLRTDSFS